MHLCPLVMTWPWTWVTCWTRVNSGARAPRVTSPSRPAAWRWWRQSSGPSWCFTPPASPAPPARSSSVRYGLFPFFPNILFVVSVDLTYCVYQDQVFCERHYAEKMKPRCGTCDELIFSGTYTRAMGRDWHTGHFR